MPEEIDIYVDGSWDTAQQCAKWAFIVVKNNQNIYSNKGIITNPEVNEGQQIGGELKAVIEGVKWCKQNNVSATFWHDYIGIKMWCADIFGGKPWKTNKKYTKAYRDYILNNKQFIKEFKWVKGHADCYWNNKVDELAGS